MEPHLHSLLLKIYLERELFSQQHVRIVRLGESFFQIFKLLLSKYCSVSPLPLTTAATAVRHTATQGTQCPAAAGEERPRVQAGVLRGT